MYNSLEIVLNSIGKKLQEVINLETTPRSMTYGIIDIGGAADVLGYPKLEDRFGTILSWVPLHEERGEVKLEIKRNELADCVQLDSGIIVKETIAEEAGLTGKKYSPPMAAILITQFKLNKGYNA